MKTCPNCKKEIPDNAKFCTHCGTNLENANLCPSCGKPLKDKAKFCVHCGAGIDSVSAQNEDVVPSCENINTQTEDSNIVVEQSKSSQKENNASASRNLGLIVFAIIAVICAILGKVIFFSSKGNKEESTHQNNTTYVTEYVEDVVMDTIQHSSLEDEIRVELESIECEDGETYILTLKDDYEAEAYGDDAWGDSVKFFKKGEVLFDSHCHIWIEKTEGGYKYTERGDGEYFIPEDYVHVKTYQWGHIPNSILDKVILRFTAKDGNQLHLCKLNRNGHVLYKEFDDEKIYGDFYVMIGDEDYGVLQYNDDICGYMSPIEVDNGGIDKNGNISYNFYVYEFNSGMPVYFYIPSEKAFLHDGVLYYLSAIEENKVEKEEKQQRQNERKNYPSWIIDKWHISTPSGLFVFDLKASNKVTFKVNKGDNEGTPTEGEWEYIKTTPYCKVLIHLPREEYTLLVSEEDKVIATDKGYALQSSNHPERNSYAHPVQNYTCRQCGGSGRIAQRGGGNVLGYMTCPNCGGSGKIVR